MKPRSLSALLLPAFAAVLPASAAILELNPVADTYVRGGTSNPGAQLLNFSSSTQLLVGTIAGTGDVARSLFTFNLTDPVLAGATINSVTLTFTIDGNDTGSTNTSVSYSVHQLTQSYTVTEANWANAATGTPWSTYTGSPLFQGGGGVFNPTSLTSASINPVTTALNNELSFGSSSGLVSLVQSSLTGSFTLLIKQTTEPASGRNLIRLASQDSTNPDRRPVLTIDYTPAPIPEPSAFAALAGLAMLGFASTRRRR
jgi:hypothetical protein